MHSESHKEMAIPRMLNSNTPFTIVTADSELSFLGKEESSQGWEKDTDSLVQAIGPHLTHVMQHGTAKHVITDDLERLPCVSIVAQAESKKTETQYTVEKIVYPLIYLFSSVFSHTSASVYQKYFISMLTLETNMEQW